MGYWSTSASNECVLHITTLLQPMHTYRYGTSCNYIQIVESATMHGAAIAAAPAGFESGKGGILVG